MIECGRVCNKRDRDNEIKIERGRDEKKWKKYSNIKQSKRLTYKVEYNTLMMRFKSNQW